VNKVVFLLLLPLIANKVVCVWSQSQTHNMLPYIRRL